jgi:hypothetical protein
MLNKRMLNTHPETQDKIEFTTQALKTRPHSLMSEALIFTIDDYMLNGNVNMIRDTIGRTITAELFEDRYVEICGDTVFARVLETCDLDIVDTLIDLGFRPRGVDLERIVGWFCLDDDQVDRQFQRAMLSRYTRYIDINSFLLFGGQTGSLALNHACMTSQPALVETLLALGANPRLSDTRGYTALDIVDVSFDQSARAHFREYFNVDEVDENQYEALRVRTRRLIQDVTRR